MLFMYRRILIPVDGSAPSDAALGEALEFAKEQGATARLVYICEPLQYILAEGPVDLTAEVRRQGEKVLAAATARAGRAAVAAETALVETADRRVADAIAEEARRWGADLIAMGTHGRRGFEHLVLGSVAEGVLRRATAPVLLLRSR
jgi:nucleotide-binding universal stress UspA family protein